MLESNPSITTEELAALVERKLETEERALKNAKNVFDTEKKFVNLRILGWIKLLDNRKEWTCSAGVRLGRLTLRFRQIYLED